MESNALTTSPFSLTPRLRKLYWILMSLHTAEGCLAIWKYKRKKRHCKGENTAAKMPTFWWGKCICISLRGREGVQTLRTHWGGYEIEEKLQLGSFKMHLLCDRLTKISKFYGSKSGGGVVLWESPKKQQRHYMGGIYLDTKAFWKPMAKQLEGIYNHTQQGFNNLANNVCFSYGGKYFLCHFPSLPCFRRHQVHAKKKWG